MLVLTISSKESIVIGDAIITIESREGDDFSHRRIYIEAPLSVPIKRIPRHTEGKRRRKREVKLG